MDRIDDMFFMVVGVYDKYGCAGCQGLIALTQTIPQMRFISVILSEARNLKSGTGLRAAILDSSLRCAAFRMTDVRTDL